MGFVHVSGFSIFEFSIWLPSELRLFLGNFWWNLDVKPREFDLADNESEFSVICMTAANLCLMNVTIQVKSVKSTNSEFFFFLPQMFQALVWHVK